MIMAKILVVILPMMEDSEQRNMICGYLMTLLMLIKCSGGAGNARSIADAETLKSSGG